MNGRLVDALTCATALGAGLVGGVFFAFSTFVMRALGRLPSASGIAAMQSINITVLNAWFLGVFLGTGVLSLLLVVVPGTTRLRLCGALIYIGGAVAVTIVCNVPRNHALSAMRPESPDAQALWARFLHEWTAWNHVRTAAALVAALLLTCALIANRTTQRRGLPAGLALAAAPFLTGGCLGNFRVCDPPPPALLAHAPERLSDTGLYAPGHMGTLAPGVRSYTPQFELWSDGSSKRRFVFLPQNARIDSTDMNEWQFPQGTKLWKEFTRDGVRIETRLLERVGPGPDDWLAVAYVWRSDGDAHVAIDGAVDVGGTSADVPAARECAGCHGGRKSRVLGFSAVQLAHSSSEVNLQSLVAHNQLTQPPAQAPEVPGNATARSALGYLHANCSHCHNQQRPSGGQARCFAPENALDFSLPAEPVNTVEETPTYVTGAGFAFVPGDPNSSRMLDRMGERGAAYVPNMPPLGTERVHNEAMVLLRRWIAEMKP